MIARYDERFAVHGSRRVRYEAESRSISGSWLGRHGPAVTNLIDALPEALASTLRGRATSSVPLWNSGKRRLRKELPDVVVRQ